MSGVFNPNEPGITATDDPEVAKAHGLEFDPAAARYIKPAQTSDAGGRDGDEAYDRKRQAYIAEGEAQQAAADEARQREADERQHEDDKRKQADDEARQREADEQEQRRLRDESQDDHDALKEGLAPGEQPAATESGTAEPVKATKSTKSGK